MGKLFIFFPETMGNGIMATMIWWIFCNDSVCWLRVRLMFSLSFWYKYKLIWQILLLCVFLSKQYAHVVISFSFSPKLSFDHHWNSIYREKILPWWIHFPLWFSNVFSSHMLRRERENTWEWMIQNKFCSPCFPLTISSQHLNRHSCTKRNFTGYHFMVERQSFNQYKVVIVSPW